MSLVTIELARIGKPPRTYHEEFMSDNGIELRTLSRISQEDTIQFSQGWQAAGCFTREQFARVVRKTLFYHEYFCIMQLLDRDEHSLGCYVDIATPLQKQNGIYKLTDLILDLWIFPDGRYEELDVGEFEQAVASRIISQEWEAYARKTFISLKNGITAGKFPDRYIKGKVFSKL
jgi:uncharacterized protein